MLEYFSLVSPEVSLLVTKLFIFVAKNSISKHLYVDQ